MIVLYIKLEILWPACEQIFLCGDMIVEQDGIMFFATFSI